MTIYGDQLKDISLKNFFLISRFYERIFFMGNVRPNQQPLSILVRVVVLRITCVIPKLVVTCNVTSISRDFYLTLSHDVLLMLASWMGRAFAFSRVQPVALATHALKDIPLTTLALASVFSLVILASVRLWPVESMMWLWLCCFNSQLSTQGCPPCV